VRRKGVQKYLPVVAGVVGVFATGLMWKKITKVFGGTRR
jgi:hypothetical protein